MHMYIRVFTCTYTDMVVKAWDIPSWAPNELLSTEGWEWGPSLGTSEDFHTSLYTLVYHIQFLLLACTFPKCFKIIKLTYTEIDPSFKSYSELQDSDKNIKPRTGPLGAWGLVPQHRSDTHEAGFALLWPQKPQQRFHGSAGHQGSERREERSPCPPSDLGTLDKWGRPDVPVWVSLCIKFPEFFTSLGKQSSSPTLYP